MPESALSIWFLLLPLAFLGGLAGGTTGFGIYLVFGPALWALLSPTAALATGLTAGLPAVALLWFLRQHIIWTRVQTLMLWAIPGALVGVTLHQILGDTTLQLLSAAVILLVLLAYKQQAFSLPTRLAGLLTGSLGTSVGFNGPPAALAFFGEEEKSQRASTMVSLFLVSILTTAAFVLQGVIFQTPLTDFQDGYVLGCILLLPVGAGLWVGNSLAGHLGKHIEQVSIALSLIGVALLVIRAF